MDNRQVAALQRRIENLERQLQQAVRNLAQVTQVTRTSANSVDEGASAWPSQENSTDRNPRRFQHYGFRSRPPAATPVVQLLIGGGGAAEAVVAEDDPNAGPQDLASGETALYSIGQVKAVFVDKNGGVTVVAAAGQPVNVTSGAGANVVLNGGRFPVARATQDTAGPYSIVGGNLTVLA